MDIIELSHDFMMNFVNNAKFPYRTGQLHDNFRDKFGIVVSDDDRKISFSVLENPIVNYGRILEVAPTIKYRAIKNGKNGYIEHRNRHYRYIERISDSLVPLLEQQYGVKYVGK